MSERDTRTTVLDAATELFANKGFAGASIRAITARARANLGAVTYHFGSKAALFETVLGRALSTLLARLTAAARPPGPPLARLEAVVRAHFTLLSEHPEFRRLMLRVLVQDRAIPATAVAHFRRAVLLVAGVIQDGQRDGSIRPGDPRLLTLAVMSQPIMLNALRPLLRVGPAVDLDDPTTRAQALENAIRFIRAGLRPSPEES